MKDLKQEIEKLDLDWLARFLTIYGITLPRARKLIVESACEIIPSLVEFPYLRNELLVDKLAENVRPHLDYYKKE